jgi:predicted dehydrogenase
MSLKIAIVGCGKIADAHVEEVRKIPTAELCAVCDTEPVIAEQLATRYAIPRWYSDLGKLLETEAPDVLHITTPPQSHLALTRMAVAAGCHVFLEKPIALRHCDTQAIFAAAKVGGRKLSVNYWPKFEAPALELRRLYESGTLGDIVHIESSYGYNLEGDFGMAFRRDPEHWVNKMPGKLFQNVLDHILNRITPFIEDDNPEINAFAFSGDPGGSDMLDELRGSIRGAKSTAYATFSAHARPVGQTLRVYGTRNTAFIDFVARTLVLERKQAIPSALGRLLPAFLTAKDYLGQGFHNANRFRHSHFHFFDGMRTLLTEFYTSIEQNTAPPIPYEEILRVSALMERIFEQVYPEVRA